MQLSSARVAWSLVSLSLPLALARQRSVDSPLLFAARVAESARRRDCSGTLGQGVAVGSLGLQDSTGRTDKARAGLERSLPMDARGDALSFRSALRRHRKKVKADPSMVFI